jgi:hypothetical protein
MDAISSFPASLLTESLNAQVPWLTRTPLYSFTNTTLCVAHPDVPRESHEYGMSSLISFQLE